MKVVTDTGPEIVPTTATTSIVPMSGSRIASGERTWSMADRAGRATLVRKHPLTVEGDDMGVFELVFGCGEAGKDFSVSYVEQRRVANAARPAEFLTEVEISISGKTVPLKVVSSRSGSRPREIESMANGTVPAELVKSFADPRSRSLTVETTSADMATAIRVGNAGVTRGFAQLAASCGVGPAVARAGFRREAEAQPR